MFSKGVSSILLIAYFLSVSGVSVFKHYCGNELASSSIYVMGEKCGCNESGENKDCCKDETQFLKNYQSHTNSNFIFSIIEFHYLGLCIHTPAYELVLNASIAFSETYRPPPNLETGNTKCIRMRQLLI